MEVVLLLSAERDLQEAYNWVEEHRRGREQFFLQDVELRLEHLQKFPLIGRLYRGRYRRLLIPTMSCTSLSRRSCWAGESDCSRGLTCALRDTKAFSSLRRRKPPMLY